MHAPPPLWQDALCALVLDRYGVVLDADRTREVIAPRLLAQAQQRGLSPQHLVASLTQASPQSAEENWLRELITIGETSFGRDPQQIGLIGAFLVRLHQHLQRPLRLWSAACSTGEEPYTLSMLLAEHQLPGTVLGTDLNESALRFARRGTSYADSRLLSLPEHWRLRWFRQEASGWTILPDIQQRVRFQTHNLMSRLPPSPEDSEGWDAILCRNVLIYFPSDKVTFVVHKLLGALSPDGALFLGANEPFPALPPDMRRTRLGDRFIYQRLGALSPTDSPRSPRPHAAAPARPAQAARPPERPPLESADLRARIRYLLDREMWIALEAVLRDHLRREPRSGLAWLELGALLLRQHRFADALSTLEVAGHHLPGSAEVWYLCGVIHYKTQDLAQAEQALSQAARHDHRFWPAMVLLGGLAADRGEPALARQHLSHARSILEHLPLPVLLESQCAQHVASVHQNPEGSLQATLRELRQLGETP